MRTQLAAILLTLGMIGAAFAAEPGNEKGPTKVVPEALKAAVGLYGFTKPRTMSGLVPLDGILSRPVSELQGDDRNIAVLARAYHRVSIHAVRNEKGRFVEPMK